MSNRGGARPGAGRKKGSVNRATAEARATAAETGELPLQYMLRIMRDPRASNTRRDEMARPLSRALSLFTAAQFSVAAPMSPPSRCNDPLRSSWGSIRAVCRQTLKGGSSTVYSLAGTEAFADLAGAMGIGRIGQGQPGRTPQGGQWRLGGD